jgi:hypothetical protein
MNPAELTAEEYLNHLISVSHLPGAVQTHHLVLLRKLIAEGNTGVYVP